LVLLYWSSWSPKKKSSPIYLDQWWMKTAGDIKTKLKKQLTSQVRVISSHQTVPENMVQMWNTESPTKLTTSTITTGLKI
jgi:hypothetical protein